jgi:hypothetical protein
MILPRQRIPLHQRNRRPAILLRRAPQKPPRHRIPQRNRLAQPPQIQNLIRVARHLAPRIEVGVADPAVLGDLAAGLAARDARDILDSRDGRCRVQPEAPDAAGDEVPAVFVVFFPEGDVGHVRGFDAHEDVLFAGLGGRFFC